MRRFVDAAGSDALRCVHVEPTAVAIIRVANTSRSVVNRVVVVVWWWWGGGNQSALMMHRALFRPSLVEVAQRLVNREKGFAKVLAICCVFVRSWGCSLRWA